MHIQTSLSSLLPSPPSPSLPRLPFHYPTTLRQRQTASLHRHRLRCVAYLSHPTKWTYSLIIRSTPPTPYSQLFNPSSLAMIDNKKRKHSLESSSTSPLDALWKRQRRISSSHRDHTTQQHSTTYPSHSSHSSSASASSYLTRASLSDSDPDEDDAGPSTPAFIDDNMDWAPDDDSASPAELLATPNQVRPSPPSSFRVKNLGTRWTLRAHRGSYHLPNRTCNVLTITSLFQLSSTRIPQGRDSSPSSSPDVGGGGGGAIHHLELLREAKPPVISSPTQLQKHVRSPPPHAIMTLEVRHDAYLFAVELPGYAPEVR